MWSVLHFVFSSPWLIGMLPYLAFTALYFCISLVVNLHVGGFNLSAHNTVVQRHSGDAVLASVDILLPTAGEDTTVLANTWNGVRALCSLHEGPTAVIVLDDADRPEVRNLAALYGFSYSVRDNRGWYKKAGNLRHGYALSRQLQHDFVVIFDADFRPRTDFLRELLPYFYADPRLGLVQSPQYFDVLRQQPWLQRGAGSVQEFFYRFSQVARQSHGAAICVGTNAIYRRAALEDTGGTALIEHSEDVHTGFNMRMHGWDVRYVPLILAKGVCPDSMESYFKQQYRWCMGSMSLLGSAKFWETPMSFRARLCYFTGFCYYIHTAMTLFFVWIIPLVLLTVAPYGVTPRNYLLLLPALAYTFVVFPLWHRTDFGSEVWAVKHVYSWAHLFALVDVLRGTPMGWSPTGAARGGSSGRYRVFRIGQVLVGFLPCIAWVVLAGVRVVVWREWQFLPLLVTGTFVAYTTGRVTLYRQRSQASDSYHLIVGAPTVQMQVVVPTGDRALEVEQYWGKGR
jgi:cellulose synthase (UDP-forming)